MASSTYLVALLLLSIGLASSDEDFDTDDNDTENHSHGHLGIHVASWRWGEIGLFYTLTLFVIICGLAKIAFHHAHFLSAHIPESCLMIVVGVSVGSIIFFSEVGTADGFMFPKFTPKMFFLVLLPPVILEAAYSLYDRAFANNLGTVLLYAVLGTLLNTFTIGPLLFLLSKIGAMGEIDIPSTLNLRVMPTYNLTMTDCLVFSALISAVDPVAVLAIFQEIGVNKDLYYLVFGESLLNDAVTVVLYTTMVEFNKMPVIPAGQYGLATLAFFTSSLGGLAIGVVFGLMTALITRTTKDIRVVEPLAVLGIAYLSYLSAELFHFSGIISIIGCGLVQAHYALRNISHKSHTTVIYFVKMLSSTSDAIIFLFLGIVCVGDHHVWHTGFVMWTLLLCLLCRFGGVFALTAIANVFRVSQINLQEQFLMAYGGLRGAVAFSLVEMLDRETVEPRQVFVTTTLVVIFFTVFIQGSTIKPLVRLLHIRKTEPGKKKMIEELNDNIISNLMAGVEEMTGVRGDWYIRSKFGYWDETYLHKIFLVQEQENDLTRLNRKLALMEHFAHLYGPVTLVEDHKADLFRNEGADGEDLTRKLSTLMRQESYRANGVDRSTSLPVGVELRRRNNAKTSAPIDVTKAELLRKAFRNYPHQKFPATNPDDRVQINERLLQRQMTARCITALVNRQPSFTDPTRSPVNVTRQSLPVTIPEDNVMQQRRRLIHSDLEESFPEELEGMDVILDRVGKRRLLRSMSDSSDSTHTQSPFVNRPNQALDGITETEMDVFLPK